MNSKNESLLRRTIRVLVGFTILGLLGLDHWGPIPSLMTLIKNYRAEKELEKQREIGLKLLELDQQQRLNQLHMAAKAAQEEPGRTQIGEMLLLNQQDDWLERMQIESDLHNIEWELRWLRLEEGLGDIGDIHLRNLERNLYDIKNELEWQRLNENLWGSPYGFRD